MNDDIRPTPPQSRAPRRRDSETLSGGAVVAIMAVLAVVVTAGYLFAMKMIAVSKLDDCILGHRRNCEPPPLP